jgi:hypothetical protein
VTACIHTPARCNGGGYDGCACGNTDPVHTDRQREAVSLAAELERVTAALRRFAISEEVDGPCWCGCYPGLRLPHDSHSEDCVAARAALAGGARAAQEGDV